MKFNTDSPLQARKPKNSTLFSPAGKQPESKKYRKIAQNGLKRYKNINHSKKNRKNPPHRFSE